MSTCDFQKNALFSNYSKNSKKTIRIKEQNEEWDKLESEGRIVKEWYRNSAKEGVKKKAPKKKAPKKKAPKKKTPKKKVSKKKPPKKKVSKRKK